jgi:hypothetical protein
VQGKDELFSGKIVDTLAQRILEYEVVDGKKNGEFRISSLTGEVMMAGNIKNNLNEGLWVSSQSRIICLVLSLLPLSMIKTSRLG